MRFFQLFFFAALSATILTGCERQLLSPIAATDPSQTTTQFAEMALSELADTAAERGFVDLANAANEVAEVLTVETGTTKTAFSKLVQEATALQHGFASANCGIKLEGFAIASERAANAYATEAAEPSVMEQTLANLAQEALNTEGVLQQFPAENPFMPFAFGYAPNIDSYEDYVFYVEPSPAPDPGPPYELGVILIQYDETIQPATETRTAVVDFLTLKGYTVQVNGVLPGIERIDLGVDVDPYSIMEELITIPGVALLQPNFLYSITMDPDPELLILSFSSVQIIDKVREKYNEAWCQGNFDIIDSILIEESGLDFFDYAFVRNLTDIYAEEIPEAAARIRTNSFSLRSIAITFHDIQLHYADRGQEYIIELFRQSIRKRGVTIAHKTQDQNRSDDWRIFTE